MPDRPAKTNFSVRIDVELSDWITAEAIRDSRPRSSMGNVLLREARAHREAARQPAPTRLPGQTVLDVDRP